MVIVETRVFTNRIHGPLSDEDYRHLQLALAARPTAGPVIPGAGGLRKFRWSRSGRGKRGGVRIIYYWHPASEQLLMPFAFAKSERADLSAEQKLLLRKVVETEYP